MRYIGIDPGTQGGISVIGPSGEEILARGHATEPWLLPANVVAIKMPATERDLLDAVTEIGTDNHVDRRVFCCVERVNAGVFGHGKIGRMGVTSAFTFGRGVGRLEMALVAANIPFDYVSPITWQKAMGCQTHGDKNISKRRAQQLFPSLKVTHATADSLLIAEYCRRIHGQEARQGTEGKEQTQRQGART